MRTENFAYDDWRDAWKGIGRGVLWLFWLTLGPPNYASDAFCTWHKGKNLSVIVYTNGKIRTCIDGKVYKLFKKFRKKNNWKKIGYDL
jgi:hypothetical protein